MMNNTNYKTDRLPAGELRRIIEPLANYICATDQPRKMLASALATLFSEVEATNRVAIAHFHTCSEN